jgi:maltose O-acetyltransferase
MGMNVAWSAVVRPGVYFRDCKVSIGRSASVNAFCRFDNREWVVIGDRVGVGIGVNFITSTHDYSDPSRRAGVGSLAPIKVCDGAWLGSSVTLLAGVIVGPGTVVAAGSVATQDCKADAIYAGAPARPIRDL